MPNTAQFILNRLTEWGIKRVYGYPGDGINSLLGAFHEVGDKLEFIQTRHEEIASFAACAHAKFTGEVGVCMATSGPGAIHLLNGLYDAKLDHQPVVAIIGQQKRMSLGANYQQEVDLNTLYKDVASEYLMTIMDPTQARHVIDRAIRIANDSRHPDRGDRARRRAGGRVLRAAARARRGVLLDRLLAAADPPARRGPPAGGRDPQRRARRWRS